MEKVGQELNQKLQIEGIGFRSSSNYYLTNNATVAILNVLDLIEMPLSVCHSQVLDTTTNIELWN